MSTGFPGPFASVLSKKWIIAISIKVGAPDAAPVHGGNGCGRPAVLGLMSGVLPPDPDRVPQHPCYVEMTVERERECVDLIAKPGRGKAQQFFEEGFNGRNGPQNGNFSLLQERRDGVRAVGLRHFHSHAVDVGQTKLSSAA
jgi:hypothetical protein